MEPLGDLPELEFIYADCDNHEAEIAELYTYTEEPEFFLNKRAFEELLEQFGMPEAKWRELKEAQRRTIVLRLVEIMESADREKRIKAARATLYLLQGVFGECTTLEEQPIIARENAFFLNRFGVFQIFVQALHLEIDNTTVAASAAAIKSSVSLGDSCDLRVILCVLYSMVEIMRCKHADDTDDMKAERDEFCNDLAQPIIGDDLLAVTLFQMTTRFCSGSAPHFPIKKILLLLWKTLLVSLGGMEKLQALKAKYREDAGLRPVPDDTIEVVKHMRAASPPASATDMLEAQQQRKTNRQFKRQSLVKQSSMDDALAYQEGEGDEKSGGGGDPLVGGDDDDEIPLRQDLPPTPSESGERSGTPIPEQNEEPDGTGTAKPEVNKSLPWVPKARQQDIETFLDQARLKFVGYQLQNDLTSLVGLPEPIHHGLKILEKHLYTPLSELHWKRELDLSRHPISMKHLDLPPTGDDATPVEVLYQAMLPALPQYMIALLKILLAAAPTSKAKTESVNIMADVVPEEMPITVLQNIKLTIDANRHKEILVKAISAILLLLLKHFKLNHVVQFEYMSQQLMFANCIPLVLKFFNQNIMSYIASRNSVPVIDFCACVIGEQPELTPETMEMGELQQPYCWRNLFSCINLLRVLNKLTKWKHSRVMMLVVFKSAPILKRALKVRQAMLQLYALKLLKMQSKYLGRQWRKSNMKTMSAIYQKVRHRLNDDWAYGNDLDARPWDFQADEFALQAAINQFHQRRYDRPPVPQAAAHLNNADPTQDFTPVDNNLLSVLGAPYEICDDFKRNYEPWLKSQVLEREFDWELLLDRRYL